jgi:subtilase family serine protease
MKLVAPLVAALAIAACNGGGPSNLPSAPGSAAAQTHSIPQWQATHSAVAACPGDRWHGLMQCDALTLTGKGGGMQPNVSGLGPPDFQARYQLPSGTKGMGQTVAIVDAYDNPNVASDLAVYRSNYGLPTVNFTKYNQNGQIGNYPQGNTNWGFEEDLDVDMVSASCPNCAIYLIEANSNSFSDLNTAEKEAVTLGATIITNSWGGGGGGSDSAFKSPGVVYLASSGDSGYGEQDPADFTDVVSIGGTVLQKSGSSYTEMVWRDTGGGCSVIVKPSWQHDPSCSKRTGNDISAVAFGVAVYDTYGGHGWTEAGGTSVSSPLLAGVYALAANQATHTSGKPFWGLSKKKLKKGFNKITSGSDGCPGSIAGSYLCTAGTGQYGAFYSGPAGFGTPKGISAF